MTLVAGRYRYDEEIAKECEYFLKNMTELAAWAKKKHGLNPDQIRLVFNFDN
jgi:hypothetical protein